jgi:hypothetical protein
MSQATSSGPGRQNCDTVKSCRWMRATHTPSSEDNRYMQNIRVQETSLQPWNSQTLAVCRPHISCLSTGPSVMCSQEFATGPYPEPDESSPYYPILFLQDPFLYYLTTYVWVFLIVSFLLALPKKSYIHFISPPCVLHVFRMTLTVCGLYFPKNY